MRRSDEKPLKQAIEEFLKTFKLDQKLNETRLVASWEKVVGPLVAKHTRKLTLQRRILYVTIDSAALRNELMFAREKVVTALNRSVGINVIDELVFN